MLSKLSLEKSVVKSRFLVFLLLIISLFLLLSAVSAEELTGVDANMGSDFLSDDQPVDNSNGGDDNSEGDNVADGGSQGDVSGDDGTDGDGDNSEGAGDNDSNNPDESGPSD